MRLAKISWPKAKEYFSNNDSIIFAIGSIESHGKHNVLGVDTLIPDKLLDMIEQKSNVLIAPTLPYGSCDTLASFPGTISLGPDVLYDVLAKIVDGFYELGVRRFYFLNGHGGNIGTLDRIALELSRKGALGVQFNWWLMAWDLNPEWKGGHGGAEETSAMLAVDPALVDISAIEEMNLIDDLGENMPSSGFKGIRYKGVEIPVLRDVTRFSHNGWIGPDHPKNATQKWGNEMLASVCDYIVDFMDEFNNVELPNTSVRL